MFVRFRSIQRDGVFFYTAHKGDYILLELTNGKVAASVNLGSGSVTIATKKDGYNDNQWHRVRLERIKRSVNLTVDNLDTSKGETPGAFDKFHLPGQKTSFVLGGLAGEKRNKLKSISRKNFTGCLQELTFNGYDLFGKFNASAKEVVLRGKSLKTCPIAPTTPSKIVTTAMTKIFESSTRSSTTSKVFSVTSSSTKLPCILPGISCAGTTTGGPTTQMPAVTSEISTGKRGWSLSTKNQAWSTSRSQSTLRPKTIEATPDTSSNPSKNNNFQSTTRRWISSTKKVTQDNGVFQTTGEVIMQSRNERNEGDLTVWFILAAVVGCVAFVLALLIIVRVSAANRKKYAVKGKRYERDYWTDTGSFQRTAKPTML